MFNQCMADGTQQMRFAAAGITKCQYVFSSI